MTSTGRPLPSVWQRSSRSCYPSSQQSTAQYHLYNLFFRLLHRTSFSRRQQILNDEEMDEEDYQKSHVEFGAAFRDLEDLAPDEVPEAPDAPEDAPAGDRDVDTGDPRAATATEASTTAARDLLEGNILSRVVALHRGVFAAATAADRDPSEREGEYKGWHALGMATAGSLGGVLPAWVDEVAGPGHLMRACSEARAVLARDVRALGTIEEEGARAKKARKGDARRGEVDVTLPCVSEAALLLAPVGGVRSRLEELLAEWPEHPVLLQLHALCERIISLPPTAPLKEAMVGLELLLARAQVWEESAARHVSIAEPLRSVAALATRWRRMELDSWESALETACEKHASAAHKNWFHLLGLLLGSLSGEVEGGEGEGCEGEGGVGDRAEDKVREAASTVEHFLQTSTVGQLRRRLQMLWVFHQHVRSRADRGCDRARRLANITYNTFRCDPLPLRRPCCPP